MKKNVLLTSILTIVLCLSLCVGGTFALFTSEDTTDIGVTSGKVDVSATIDVESAKAYSMDVLQADGNFSNGGFSTVTENAVTLDKVTPGDKVTFNINIVNNSNVITKYRSKVTCVGGFELYGLLNITFDGLQPTWQQLAVGEGNKTISVVVELPQTVGNEAQDLSTKLVFAVEAVQGNAEVVDEVVSQIEQSSTGSVVVPADNTQNVVVKTNTGAVKVNVPASRVDTVTNKIDVNVTPIVDQVEQAKFTISSGADAVYYDIDVAGMNASAENCTVDMFVGKGLVGVSVYHNDNGVVSAIEGATYNAKTGYVTFQTATFSPFAVEAFDSALYTSITKDEVKLSGKGTAEENAVALKNAVNYVNDSADIYLANGNYDIKETILFPVDMYLYAESNKAVLNNLTTAGAFKTAESVYVEFYDFTVNVGDSTAFISDNSGDISLYGGKYLTNTGYIGYASNSGTISIDSGSADEPGYFEGVDTNDLFGDDGTDSSPYSISDGIFKNFNPGKSYNKANTYLCDGFMAIENRIENTFTVKFINRFSFDNDYTLTGDMYIYPRVSISKYASIFNIKNDFNLNLNGYTINVVSNDNLNYRNKYFCLFRVENPINVKIYGNGGIVADINSTSSCDIMDIKNENAIVTVEDGNYMSDTTTFYVELGKLIVNGGKYDLTERAKLAGDTANYIINCLDASFKDGTAKISVTGGTFVGTDLKDVEGANTTYIADGYVAMETEVAGTYKVIGSDFFKGNVKLTGDLVIPVPTTAGSGLRPFFNITNDCTIDMNGHTIKTNYKEGSINGVPCFMAITEEVTVTITGNGKMDAEAGDNSCYCINLNNANAVLNIENGTFLGAPTGIQVQKGVLNVKGGLFDMSASCKKAAPTMAKYVINCIDASFKEGTANIYMTGGTTVGFDMSGKPEASDKTYVADGYKVVEEVQANGENWYKVVKNETVVA